ncbi:hypothetical protein DFR50_10547 [Roseiarcus fermentans]|uniref:Uncharacterized protein n=2 Tax=Roseiarcus fermentans TaxID=1473586 RepID=A0A366FQI8_9HYPH|nr:hypothetical protein DFR50_10547 [Roseiarcus fermentans]
MHGSNPEMVLSTMLWRAGPTEGIVRLKSGGYWLEGRPLGEDTSEQTDTNSDPPDTESTDMLE